MQAFIAAVPTAPYDHRIATLLADNEPRHDQQHHPCSFAAQAESVINGTGSPQLQMVRQCSATPDLAADFFARVLHPDPRKRLGASALFHPYLKAVTTQMTTDLGREGK